MEDSTNKKYNFSNDNFNMFDKYILKNNPNNKNNDYIENNEYDNNNKKIIDSNFKSINKIKIEENREDSSNQIIKNSFHEKLTHKIESTNCTNQYDPSVINPRNYFNNDKYNFVSEIKSPFNITHNNQKIDFKDVNNTCMINSDNSNIYFKSPENDNGFDFNANMNFNCNDAFKKNSSLISPIKNKDDFISKKNNNYIYKYNEIYKNNNNSSYQNINMNTTENESNMNKEYPGKLKFIFRDNQNNYEELKKKLESQEKVIQEYENWLVLLLNILSQTKFQNYLKNVELVKFIL